MNGTQMSFAQKAIVVFGVKIILAIALFVKHQIARFPDGDVSHAMKIIAVFVFLRQSMETNAHQGMIVNIKIHFITILVMYVEKQSQDQVIGTIIVILTFASNAIVKIHLYS